MSLDAAEKLLKEAAQQTIAEYKAVCADIHKAIHKVDNTIDNNGSTSPAEIAADMETVDRNFDDYSKAELCTCIRNWSQQLRACR